MEFSLKLLDSHVAGMIQSMGDIECKRWKCEKLQCAGRTFTKGKFSIVSVRHGNTYFVLFSGRTGIDHLIVQVDEDDIAAADYLYSLAQQLSAMISNGHKKYCEEKPFWFFLLQMVFGQALENIVKPETYVCMIDHINQTPKDAAKKIKNYGVSGAFCLQCANSRLLRAVKEKYYSTKNMKKYRHVQKSLKI